MAGAEGKGAGPRVLLGQARHWFPATDLVPLSPGSGALQSFGRFRRKISRVSPGPLTPAPAAECVRLAERWGPERRGWKGGCISSSEILGEHRVVARVQEGALSDHRFQSRFIRGLAGSLWGRHRASLGLWSSAVRSDDAPSSVLNSGLRGREPSAVPVPG